MTTDLTGLIPHGWAGGEAVTKWWRGKHLHLYRLRKNCAQCGKEMVLDVTKAAITGTAKNAGLHLTRCMGCREASKSEGGTSRPRTKDDPIETQIAAAHVAAPPQEVEMYLKSIQALQGQLQELHAKYKAVFDENSKLKAKLAPYELAPAMEAAKPFDPHAMLAKELGSKKKLPWE